jgi:diguanylate cyclase (GGDEF)-like protein
MTRFKHHTRFVVLGAAVCYGLILVGYLLRHLNITVNPFLWASTEIISVFLSFTIAANILVRFYGTSDRVSLLLGLGLGLGGFIQLNGILELHRHFSSHAAQLRIPLSWMVGQTLLAILLLVSFGIERGASWPREPRKIIIAVVGIVAAASCLTATAYLAFPREPPIHPNSALPRPWDLLPASIFLAATVALNRSSHQGHSAFDAALVWTAGMNTACHLVASQSAQLLDAPAMTAQLIKIGSYTVLLGAILVDNARLFGQVWHRAISDSLTGLANYQRLLQVLQNELERSGRTERPFSVLLMDLDRLKDINDHHGHLTGSRAICRVAEVLRRHCRSIDTAARYGGDEFALVLPETDERAARRVVLRIRNWLESDVELPRLSLSVGVATHPRSGTSVQNLLEAADRELYASKARSTRKAPLGERENSVDTRSSVPWGVTQEK